MFLLCLIISSVGCSHARYASHAEWNKLVDRQNVEDTVNRLFIGTDNKNWSEVRSVFAEKVNFDMSSLTGATPTILTSQAITDMWDRGLKPVQSLQHQSGNFLINISGDDAEVFCYGTATHYKNPQFKKNVTSFVGSYNIHLKKIDSIWKIDSLRFNKKYVE